MSQGILRNEPGRAVAVVGGGPAGLMAAEVLAERGAKVDVYDAMPSVGRKFLMAGKGGMNLTHSEPFAKFVSRYGARRGEIGKLLEAFGQQQLRDWAAGLGIETFVGSSGRVFPVDMKAAPLLRAWLARLRHKGVRFHMRHRFVGWDGDGRPGFDTPDGEIRVDSMALVLALGGGSWPQLGSDGAWVDLLRKQGIPVNELEPANCGFDVAWSSYFRENFAGSPVKSVALSAPGAGSVQGEFVVTENGIEGSLVYAFSARLRDTIKEQGRASIFLDLAPGRSLPELTAGLSRPRGARSMANHLRARAGIEGVKAGLLREFLPKQDFDDAPRLAAAIKSLPVRIERPRPLREAISSAGGVPFEALDENLMLKNFPGVFCAGEMLDWEAPTGGYLFTASFATGHAAGRGALAWLGSADRLINRRSLGSASMLE